MAVIIGASVGAKGGPSDVPATQTIKDMTSGCGLTFADAGEHAGHKVVGDGSAVRSRVMANTAPWGPLQ
jgi:hypothetical protein